MALLGSIASTSWLTVFSVTALLCGVSCGSQAPADEDSDTEGTGGDDGESETEDENNELECHKALMTGTSNIGDPCNNHGDCRTRVCEVYETFLPEDAGVCLDWPTDCRTRVLATAKDAVTGTPIEGVTVYVSPITSMISDPRGAERFSEGVSAADGIIDMTSNEPIASFIAIGGVVLGEGYELSGFTVAAPIDSEGNYPPAVSYRDWYSVAESDLAAWNESLANDPEMQEHLPLEENGGVVGLIRTWAYDSTRVAGATVYSADVESSIVVRYLNEDGVTFNEEATTSSGVYVLVNAEIGESVLIGPGERIQPSPDLARMGSLSEGIWVMAPAVVPEGEGT